MKGAPDMATVDVVDFPPKELVQKKASTLGILQSEMPCKRPKDCGKKVIKAVFNKLRLKKFGSATISRPDPVYKVSYLGNVVTGWAKGEGCIEKPLTTLWRNYTQSSRPDVHMQLSVSGGGLKATTKDHGLTEYWANRLTFCSAPSHFPRIFCWVYRHEGRKLRHELRCHAVLCSSASVARQIEEQLKASLALALAEFKKDKIFRQNARLSLLNSLYEYPTIPRRKILLSSGSYNYKPPLERSKSAPKLTIIEEHVEEQDEVGDYRRRNLFQSFSSPSPRNSVQQENLFDEDASQEQQICDVNLKNTQVEEAKDQLEELENNILVLGNLLHDSLTKELMESCEEKCDRTWFTNFNEADILPVDSDEGSLSSGCETSSTVTSEAEPAHFSTIIEVEEDKIIYSQDDFNKNCIKTELDFKVGGSVSSCVRSFDQLTDTNIRKYCWINSANNNGVGNGGMLNNDQVSLVPLGECHADFSSLKVFKRRHSENAISENGLYEIRINGDDKQDDKTCDYNDEGYDEALDSPNSVTNVVLI